MNAQLLVTAPGTDRILFTNEKMDRSHDIDYDPRGLLCWKVYHDRESWCEGCPLNVLYEHPDEASSGPSSMNAPGAGTSAVTW